LTLRIFLPVLVFIPFFLATDIHGALLYKNYVVRYDRGWDILCDPYQVRQGRLGAQRYFAKKERLPMTTSGNFWAFSSASTRM
jgi:hypothetical protein